MVTDTKTDSLFLTLNSHREKLIALVTAGVFDLQSGKVEINLNNGAIQSILIVNQVYKRDSKRDVVPL